VVFDKDYLRDGTATFLYFVTKPPLGGGEPSQGPGRTASVPAVYAALPAGDPEVAFMLSDAAAQRMGAGQNGGYLVMSAPRGVTGAQEQQANRILDSLDIEEPLVVERGYHSELGVISLSVLAAALLVAVGAAAIATGLALADGRRDLETLSAVGGAPLTRRLLSGSTALVITVIGSVIGVAIGLLPPLALIESAHGLTDELPTGSQNVALSLKVPWPAIGIALIALPLATALGAALVTRSRIRLSRRLT
jgi:putative ABC transport system permease protein